MRSLIVVLPALFFLFAGVGCVKQQLQVSIDDQPSGETGHYVLLVTKRDNMRVYDCLSRPDGHSWNPTCVKADLRSEAGSTTNP